MTGQEWLWVGDGAALAVALIAGVADWRRTYRRPRLDAVGWMPWRGVQVVALFVLLACTVLALNS